MKIVSILLGFTLLASGALALNEEYRTFTSTDGKEISARILRFDAGKNVVVVQRSDKRQMKVNISVFSDEDQEYIREWGLVNIFLDKSDFKINIERNSDLNKEDSNMSSVREIKVTDHYYVIELQNRSQLDIGEVEVEYCIYYEQQDAHSGWEEGVKHGSQTIGVINGRSDKQIQSAIVKTYYAELDSDYISLDHEGNQLDATQRGRVHGIKVRAHLTTPSGRKVIKEESLPEGYGASWITKSISVGMN